ncbi:adenosylcobinamide-phosphate synthase CbiB [Azoarcus taiwanensis]|uniref:Cobalamin biosynthesis protein CobD n=1 Tax=Azoarcus taiwanensis TaxID=666964 RepID=A0A972FFP5_9RHOO|nr:adenosylcobinamide-phosphate synthase CbiB [Azoarcus taiwanensis]NMG04728.1 cobalamin biosynthesis protein [Azoarcus taiwanensis]
MLSLLLKLVLAMAADRLLGEARRWHPLVGFGKLASAIEKRVRAQFGEGRTSGLVAWGAAILPLVILAWVVRDSVPGAHWIIDIGLLYLALGGRSLVEHAEAIAVPLAREDLPAARASLALVVSRDTQTLSSEAIARAGVETVLENGHDAVFGALFWFCLLGGPGALLFRLANTLDAMWGYRNQRYLRFGWFAARSDDVLGWIPARLTALSYALLGRTRDAFVCWREQAPAWSSPNAGPVMAAGAGALGVCLGGAASYQGRTETRPTLGTGKPPDADCITRATRLVRNSAWLWLAVIATGTLIHAL